jgi:hypothetical protein
MRKQGVVFIISREWDGGTLPPEFLDRDRLILFCHMVPPFAPTAASVGSKLEQDRLSVAVSSLVSLKVITGHVPQPSSRRGAASSMNGRSGGGGYAVRTVGSGGSELLIFDRRAAPGADCWCYELHVTSCPRTTGRESNRYKAHATQGGCVPRSAGAPFTAST